MGIPAIDLIRERIAEIQATPSVVATAAAPRIEEQLKSDARTKRGNVPCFGPMGTIPIEVTAQGNEIRVTAANWVLAKAQKKGQPEVWLGIVREESARAFSGGHR
jgi:hypothetical protein